MKGIIDWNKLTMEQYIEHLEEKFKFDSSGTAKAVFQLISQNKALNLHGVSGNASDFEKDLGKLINEYVNAGLKKPDLVKKMEWMTGNCKFS